MIPSSFLGQMFTPEKTFPSPSPIVASCIWRHFLTKAETFKSDSPMIYANPTTLRSNSSFCVLKNCINRPIYFAKGIWMNLSTWSGNVNGIRCDNLLWIIEKASMESNKTWVANSLYDQMSLRVLSEFKYICVHYDGVNIMLGELMSLWCLLFLPVPHISSY